MPLKLKNAAINFEIKSPYIFSKLSSQHYVKQYHVINLFTFYRINDFDYLC